MNSGATSESFGSPVASQSVPDTGKSEEHWRPKAAASTIPAISLLLEDTHADSPARIV